MSTAKFSAVMAKGKSSRASAQNNHKSAKQGAKTGFKDMPNPNPPKGMSKERYARLVAESQAPYKGLRKFLYVSFGASGAIGGFVFLPKFWQAEMLLPPSLIWRCKSGS